MICVYGIGGVNNDYNRINTKFGYETTLAESSKMHWKCDCLQQKQDSLTSVAAAAAAVCNA